MSSSVYNRLHGIFTKTPQLKPATNSVYTRLNDIFTATPKLTSTTTSATVTIPKTPPPSITTTPNKKPEYSATVYSIIRDFKRHSTRPRFRRNLKAYETTVHRLVREKQFTAIENILEHQKKYDNIKEEGFAVRLISLYGKAKMLDHARKLFDELPSLACNRTVMSFNALLHAYVSSEKYTKIPEIFKEIPENLSIKPDAISYNTVIKAFCEMGNIDEACNILDEMKKNGFEPNIVSYNTILDAYYKSKRFTEAEKLWVVMVENNELANIRTYNVKLRGLVLNNRVFDALELLKKMEVNEMKPDEFSYRAVIKGFFDDENLEEVKKLYEKMVKNGYVPDKVIFGMIIEIACDKGDFDYAIELCKKGIELKKHIYKSMVLKLVEELVKNSRMEQAKEVVELFKSRTFYGKMKLLVTE